MVAILDESQEDGDFVAGVFADAAGTFTLNAAPGTYQLVALKPGFVADFSSLPQVTLISGINSTQNVSLLPTDRTISGRVFDEVSSEGLAGGQIFLQSAAGQAALLLTDTNGNFSAGVTSGEWSLDLSETGLRLLGYSRDNKVAVNTITGSVTGVQIALSQGRGELELVFFFSGGSFGGGTAGSIGFPTQLNYYYALFGLEDVNVPTNVFFTGPAGSGLSNTASAVFGANYEGNSVFYSSPQVYLPPFPPGGVYTVNYKNQPINFLLANPDSQNHQVLLVPTVTVNGQNQVESIQWMRRDANGNPIGVPSFMTGIEIRIDGIGGRLYDADVSADATSHVVGAPVTWTNVSSIQMVYDDVQGNQYVCFWHRGNQPLQILSSNMPTATVGTPYQFLCVGAGGQSPYSWSLQSSNLPAGLYFAPVTGEISGIPQTSGVFDLTIRLTDANSQFLTRTLSLAIQPATSVVRLETQFTINPGQFGLRMFGQAGQSYTLQYSADLSQWFPVCTTNAPSGSFELVDPNATSSMRFYRVLVNP